MTTGTYKGLLKAKARGAQGVSAPAGAQGRAGVRRPERSNIQRSLGSDLNALLGMKANLVQALERVRVEGQLSAMARRRLSTDLQALSLELLRVSVRLEEVPESTKGGAPQQAPVGEAARSSTELHETARRNREQLVQAGELVTSKTLAEKLGITPQAVTKARNEKRFFSLEVGGEDYYPGFYADPGLDRKVLEDITRVLGDLPGAEKLVFFRSALGSLGDLTPLAALRAGKRAPVERAAAAFAER